MYSDSYEQYIRSILGYPMQQSFENNQMYGYNTSYSQTYRQNSNSELEDCYPEIYKIIYPMVNKACMTNTRPVSRELVEDLTEEIYSAIEGNNEINITINLENDVRKSEVSADKAQNRGEVKVKENSKSISKEEVSKVKEDRQARHINRGLRDLIRILLIRELLGRPIFPGGNRPPMPPRPPRPPFPGGPGNRPGMRPPISPRSFENDFDIYEF